MPENPIATVTATGTSFAQLFAAGDRAWLRVVFLWDDVRDRAARALGGGS